VVPPRCPNPKEAGACAPRQRKNTEGEEEGGDEEVFFALFECIFFSPSFFGGALFRTKGDVLQFGSLRHSVKVWAAKADSSRGLAESEENCCAGAAPARCASTVMLDDAHADGVTPVERPLELLEREAPFARRATAVRCWHAMLLVLFLLLWFMMFEFVKSLDAFVNKLARLVLADSRWGTREQESSQATDANDDADDVDPDLGLNNGRLPSFAESPAEDSDTGTGTDTNSDTDADTDIPSGSRRGFSTSTGFAARASPENPLLLSLSPDAPVASKSFLVCGAKPFWKEPESELSILVKKTVELLEKGEGNGEVY
jgi:hypothetical protein